MLQTDTQEQLSLAAMHATCARAGFAFQISDRIQDNWGWDATVHVKEALDHNSDLTDFRLRFQIKATHQPLLHRRRRFSFPIDTRHYNRFRDMSGHDAPTYLIVFQMPRDKDDWCSYSPKRLVLKQCLRWVSLRNAPAIQNPNQENVTVYLPEEQVLTPDSLRLLALKRSVGEWIDYNMEGIAHADFV